MCCACDGGDSSGASGASAPTTSVAGCYDTDKVSDANGASCTAYYSDPSICGDADTSQFKASE